MVTKAELQRLRSLREKKQRETLGLFVVEGAKVVNELLLANFPFEEIYATDEWLAERTKASAGARTSTALPNTPIADKSSQREPRLVTLTSEEMARASHFPTPSSVLAIGRIKREPLPDKGLDHGVTLALDGIQDAGNVGTLLRIADWFAVDRVVMSADCADLFHQKVINASMGSFARVRVHSANLPAVLANVTIPVLGCDLEGDDVHALPALKNVVVVIGSEGRGLSPAVQSLVTRRVTIPRFGSAESLNAAVAAAIVCDNLRRAAK